MKARRPRRWQAGVMAVTAVSGVFVAASSAGATSPSPAVTYVDFGPSGSNDWLSSGAPDGSSAVRLSSSNYHVVGYDVSDDGNALVAELITGPNTANPLDRTEGLVYVQRVAGVPQTYVVSNDWDTNPVLTPDGHLWWLFDGGLTEFHDGGYQNRTYPLEADAATLFAPMTGEHSEALAMSPDGSAAGVLYRNATTGSARIFAASWANGRSGSYFEKTFATADLQPTNETFTWADNNTLLFAVHDHDFLKTATATVAPGGSNTMTEFSSGFDGFYGLRERRDGSGTWWMSKDGISTPHYGTTTDLTTPPTSLTARVDGFTTAQYVTSAQVPPALTTTAGKPSSANLAMSTSKTSYGHRAAYVSYALYERADYPGYGNLEVDRGVLQYSVDHTATWHSLGNTTAAQPVPWPNSTFPSGNGYSQVLTRNTWFRWVFPGDALVAPSTSSVREVQVVPTVTLHVATSGSYRTVYGSATRVGGTALLYRYYSGAWHKLYSTPITSSGAFSFGKHLLPHGSYSVNTVADTYWAAGSHTLTL